LVLEKLGNDLSQTPDEEATRIAGELMLKIRTQPLDGFPTLHDWAKGFKQQDRAEKIYRELLESQQEPVLLHGDLHHFNILQSRRGWLAIDPQGVIGEPAYEVGAFMRNPLGRTLEVKALQRRLDILSELLRLDRDRLKGWSYSQAVLAACWSQEDGDGYAEHWLACADKLAQT
jgi:streptomycin 6-kinase